MTQNKRNRKRARSDESPESPAQWMSPSDLKPWHDNPRLNDGAPVSRVAELIKRFGFGAPIVARAADREIIAGHTRWKAALELKLERVPVRLLDISAKDAHTLALADNRSTEKTPWQTVPLAELLTMLDTADLQLAGWDEKELARLCAHEMLPSESKEVDVEKLVKQTPKHTCPQCGCEFD